MPRVPTRCTATCVPNHRYCWRNSSVLASAEKVEKVVAQIQEKSKGKEEHFRLRDEIRAKLDEYSERIDELEGSIAELMAQAGVEEPPP